MAAIFLQGLKVMKTYCLSTIAPHVRESKSVLDSGFQDVDSGFQALDSSLRWTLIVSRIPDTFYSGFRIPLHGGRGRGRRGGGEEGERRWGIQHLTKQYMVAWRVT